MLPCDKAVLLGKMTGLPPGGDQPRVLFVGEIFVALREPRSRSHTIQEVYGGIHTAAYIRKYNALKSYSANQAISSHLDRATNGMPENLTHFHVSITSAMHEMNSCNSQILQSDVCRCSGDYHTAQDAHIKSSSSYNSYLMFKFVPRAQACMLCFRIDFDVLFCS